MKSLQSLFIDFQKLLWIAAALIIIKILAITSPIFDWLFSIGLIYFILELIKYLYYNIENKKTQPINLILNLGIVAGVLIFLGTLSIGLFEKIFFDLLKEKIGVGNIRLSIISTFYSLIIIFSVCYIIAILTYFFYLKQKKDLKIYFYTMWVFIILASISNHISKSESLSFLKATFYTISILLIIINSLRITWIAFLAKKQKLLLLFYSVIIVVLFSYILTLFSDSKSNVLAKLILEFNPALLTFNNIIIIYVISYFTILFFITLFHLPTAEAFERKAEEITSLQKFSNLLTQVFNLSDLTENLVNTTFKLCQSNSAWLRLYDSKTNSFIPYTIKNITHNEEKIISTKIIELMETNNESVNSFISRKIFSKNEMKDLKLYSSILCAKIKIQENVIGYLFSSRNKEINFDKDDENIINTLAEYSAIALDNNRMYSELIKKERLESELEVAREIQKKIIPVDTPKHKNFEIAATFIPAFEVGGDYYDFFNVTENEISFIIADVSGKGIGAAFYMALVEGIVEALSKVLKKPKEILIKTNEILKKSLGNKNFVTAIYGVIDFKRCVLELARAGHCAPILIRDEKVEYLKPSGLGLGLDHTELFANTLETQEIILKEGDLIVFYTDGISESKNIYHEDYGFKRLESILMKSKELNVEQIARNIIEDITVYTESGQQFDDITLVVMKCKGKMEKNNE